MENTQLTHAIAVEGSNKSLAKAIGKSEPTISYWKKNGVPNHWAEILKARYSKRKPKIKK